jgi:hypothetical protein
MPVSIGADVSEDGIRWQGTAGGLSPLENIVELPGVESDDGVGEECECARDQYKFLAASTAVGTDRPVVNRSLELMHRFSTHEEPVYGAAERRLRCIVA